MTSETEIEDYYIRKLQESAVQTNIDLPLLSKHLKGYVPDGRQTGIACNKFPTGVDQFKKVKVIHNGSVQYKNKTYETSIKGLRR